MAIITGGAIREAKKGAAELVVLSFLEDEDHHGYELVQLIDERIRRRTDVQFRLALRHPLQVGRTRPRPRTMGRTPRAAPAALLPHHR